MLKAILCGISCLDALDSVVPVMSFRSLYTGSPSVYTYIHTYTYTHVVCPCSWLGACSCMQVRSCFWAALATKKFEAAIAKAVLNFYKDSLLHPWCQPDKSCEHCAGHKGSVGSPLSFLVSAALANVAQKQTPPTMTLLQKDLRENHQIPEAGKAWITFWKHILLCCAAS